MIRHLIPRMVISPWGGAALTGSGSRNGDETVGRSLAFQWFGLMFELGAGVVMEKPAAPSCATLPNDVSVDQAARHLGIPLHPYTRVEVAYQLVKAGFRPIHRHANGSMSTRYVRSAAL
ncbi:hypothetical protein QP178_04725 [Sphingomonas aurantiaca]|uniref:hypothetical protein n=1 Tax=Sphingomonas aurantiaca TaxID=185949 RepID=UPI002FE11013